MLSLQTTVRWNKKLDTLPDLCVPSLRRGHAHLLCIVPILVDVPWRESKTLSGSQEVLSPFPCRFFFSLLLCQLLTLCFALSLCAFCVLFAIFCISQTEVRFLLLLVQDKQRTQVGTVAILAQGASRDVAILAVLFFCEFKPRRGNFSIVIANGQTSPRKIVVTSKSPVGTQGLASTVVGDRLGSQGAASFCQSQLKNYLFGV